MILTKQFQIHAVSDSEFKVVALCPRLANRLNKTFKTYQGHQISDGEEPVFSISALQTGLFLTQLRPPIDKGALLNQINEELVSSNTEGDE